MADLRPQYNEEVVGHGHPTKADITNRAWNVEHAEDGTHKVLPGESGIIMLFGKTAAPTGWTKKIDWQDNAMLCYATGAIVNGGAVNPQSAHTHGVGTYAGPNHTHGLGTLAGPNHTHTGPDHTHDTPMIVDGTILMIDIGQTGGNHVYDRIISTSNAQGGTAAALKTYLAGTGATGADGTGAITGAMVADGTGAITGSSANNIAPHYQEVIAATKD